MATAYTAGAVGWAFAPWVRYVSRTTMILMYKMWWMPAVKLTALGW